MGKRRKSQGTGSAYGDFKMKIKEDKEKDAFLVTFPSGYKPGSASKEEWQVYEHASNKRHALLLSTVCPFITTSYPFRCVSNYGRIMQKMRNSSLGECYTVLSACVVCFFVGQKCRLYWDQRGA